MRVEACGVCRTDLHVVDGELPASRLPIVPGHEIVGSVEAGGTGVARWRAGRRVGIPWLGHTCGVCPYCRAGPRISATRRSSPANARRRLRHPRGGRRRISLFRWTAETTRSTAPLLCAGLIGWRSLAMAGEGRRLGLYGFGAAAHIIAQVALARARGVRLHPAGRHGRAALRAAARRALGRRLGRSAAGTAGCRDHLRAGGALVPAALGR